MCDYESIREALFTLDETASVHVLGRSLLGREIPIVRLGRGERCVLYVGAQCGTEQETAGLLLTFIKDYIACYHRAARQYTYPMESLFEERSIYVVPMLNPDGAAYVSRGIGQENPLRERVLAQNGGEDLRAWCGNARGVRLDLNYHAGFGTGGACGEYPESEPEVAALCRFLRREHEGLLGVLDLHLGGEEIRCSCEDNLSAKTISAGRALARATGYRLRSPVGEPPCGRLTDWCIRALGRPAYALGCGRSAEAVGESTYGAVRRALFTFPFLV